MTSALLRLPPRRVANAVPALVLAFQAACSSAHPSANLSAGVAWLPVSSNAARHAVLIARFRDCDSRLSFAHVFERGTIAIRFEGLVVLGADDAPVRHPHSLDDLQLPVVTATVDGRFLRPFVRRSPSLLIYDEHRVLFMVIQAPASVESADALARWIATQGGAQP